MFTQTLSSQQRARTGSRLSEILASQGPHGIKLFARDKNIPSAMAALIIAVALQEKDGPQLTLSQAASVTTGLSLNGRYRRWTATRTLAQIIRHEIALARIVPVFTYASLMLGAGVEIPEHAIMTAQQFDAMR